MPTESELRLHCCCFTGHRPHKLNHPESVVIESLEECMHESLYRCEWCGTTGYIGNYTGEAIVAGMDL